MRRLREGVAVPVKTIRVLNAGPVHPGRGEPSRIELRVTLDWLKGTPVATATLSPRQALSLIGQLVQAVNITDPAI